MAPHLKPNIEIWQFLPFFSLLAIETFHFFSLKKNILILKFFFGQKFFIKKKATKYEVN